ARVTVAPPAVGAEPVAATAATAVSAAARAAVVAVRVRRAPAGRAPTGGPAPTPQGGRSRSGVPDTASAPSPRASSSSSPGQAPPGTPSGSPRAGDPVRSTGDRIDRGIAPVSPQAGHTALELSETVAAVVDGAGPATVRAGR